MRLIQTQKRLIGAGQKILGCLVSIILLAGCEPRHESVSDGAIIDNVNDEKRILDTSGQSKKPTPDAATSIETKVGTEAELGDFDIVDKVLDQEVD